jgi:ankyrin repeat protein
MDEIESFDDIAKPRRPPPLDVVFPDKRLQALGAAAEQGNTAKLKVLLAESERDPEGPVDINAVSGPGANLLMYEIAARNDVAQRALLDAGANPNHLTPKGDSPMLAASFTEHSRELRLLLDCGGDPNLSDARGEPLLIKTIFASRWNNVDLLLERGANINAANASGQTAIFILANFGQWEQVLRFLDRGANPDVADSTRRTFREVVSRAKLPPNSPSAAAHAEVVKRLDTLVEHP